MIPQSYLQAWSAEAPWPDLRQVEQDLIISRALCDLFNAPALRGAIAFRGGTATNKLLFPQPLRYSEDIDLVQMQPEPIGVTIDAIREACGSMTAMRYAPSSVFGLSWSRGSRVIRGSRRRTRLPSCASSAIRRFCRAKAWSATCYC